MSSPASCRVVTCLMSSLSMALTPDSILVTCAVTSAALRVSSSSASPPGAARNAAPAGPSSATSSGLRASRGCTSRPIMCTLPRSDLMLRAFWPRSICCEPLVSSSLASERLSILRDACMTEGMMEAAFCTLASRSAFILDTRSSIRRFPSSALITPVAYFLTPSSGHSNSRRFSISRSTRRITIARTERASLALVSCSQRRAESPML
mmetsp:Transcript_37526/g.94212  ORF Transcript_37526/g.94212 Transcript_37526/m.94212 type:complete len:208 (+) Transcript_37526:1-624(+)